MSSNTTVIKGEDPLTKLSLGERSEEKGSLQSRTVFDLQQRLEAIKKDPNYKIYRNMESTANRYGKEFTCYQKAKAVMIVALFITGIVVLFLFATNHLAHISPRFFKHVQQC